MIVTIVDTIFTRSLKMIVYRKIKYEEMKVLYQYKEILDTHHDFTVDKVTEENKCTKSTTQYRA